MKISIFKIMLGFVLIGAITACNKTRSFSNRLSGETWEVVSIEGDDHPADQELPTLVFSDCDIYDETCMGEWQIDDEHAEFAWQFNDNGSQFTISNQSEMDHDHEHDHDEEEGEEDHGEHMNPVEQCQDFSGTYEVVEMKRSTMTISSDELLGHSGEMVKLTLNRVD